MFKFNQPKLKKDEAKITGSSDVPLDGDGVKEADKIGEDFKSSGGLNRLYYSTAERGENTADVIKKHLPDVKTIPAEGLHPWHLGHMEGMPESETAKEQVHLINNPDEPASGKGPLSVDKGESFNSFNTRFINFSRKLMQLHSVNPSLKLGAVTHSRNFQILNGWDKSKFASDYKPTVKDMFTSVSKPGSVNRLSKSNNNWKLEKDTKDYTKPGIYFIRHGTTAWD